MTPIDFLLSRRSRSHKTLKQPAPSDQDVTILLTAAARCPDHGKLEPWRFVVFKNPSLKRLAEKLADYGAASGQDATAVEKAQSTFANAPMIIAVIEHQKPSAKIPSIEQTYSAGAVCLSLLNAALAQGWGANWLSGWAAYDRGFVETELGLAANERVAGFIHLGTETITPADRDRPKLEDIVTWVSE